MEHKFVKTRHHAFLKKKYCATCTTDHLGPITVAAKDGKSMIAVHLFMAKAFDGVSHRRLINNIKYYATSNPIISLFTSYISSKNQVMPVNRFTSQTRSISGVIQGSVLSSQLLQLYLNDVFSFVQNCIPSPVTWKSFTPSSPRLWALLSQKNPMPNTPQHLGQRMDEWTAKKLSCSKCAPYRHGG